jgi:hypothetical protein
MMPQHQAQHTTMAEVAGVAKPHEFVVRIIHSKESTKVIATGLPELLEKATTQLKELSYNAVRFYWFPHGDESDMKERTNITLRSDVRNVNEFTAIIREGASTIFAWNKDESPQNSPQSSPPEPSGGGESRQVDLVDVASHPQFLAERAAKEQERAAKEQERAAKEQERAAKELEKNRADALEQRDQAQRAVGAAASDSEDKPILEARLEVAQKRVAVCSAKLLCHKQPHIHALQKQLEKFQLEKRKAKAVLADLQHGVHSDTESSKSEGGTAQPGAIQESIAGALSQYREQEGTSSTRHDRPPAPAPGVRPDTDSQTAWEHVEDRLETAATPPSSPPSS